MKYMAIIDADEEPVSCEFIGCNGNVTPYLIGTTTNIKAIEQGSVLDKLVVEPLTDTEQTIFVTAMLREEKVCEEVCADDEGVNLIAVCRSIERKVKKALWQ